VACGERGRGVLGSEPQPVTLSSAETRVLELVEEGLTNAEIAARLYVVEQTIKFHLSRIYKKLGVRNRVEAVRWAARNRAEGDVSRQKLRSIV